MHTSFTVTPMSGNSDWQIKFVLHAPLAKNDTNAQSLDITPFLEEANKVATESWGAYSVAILKYVKETLENKEFQANSQEYVIRWKECLERETIQDTVPLLACHFIEMNVLPKLGLGTHSNNNHAIPVIEPKKLGLIDALSPLEEAVIYASKSRPQHVNEIVDYVKTVLEDSDFQNDPFAYMKAWTQRRGYTEEVRIVEDTAKRFIDHYVLPKLDSVRANQSISNNNNVVTRDTPIEQVIESQKELPNIDAMLANAKKYAEKNDPEFVEQTVDCVKDILTNDNFRKDPLAYIKKMDEERGFTEVYRHADDTALSFMKECILPLKAIAALNHATFTLHNRSEFNASPLQFIQNRNEAPFILKLKDLLAYVIDILSKK